MSSPLLAISFNSYAARPPVSIIRVVAVVESKQQLHEIVPDGVLGYQPVVPYSLLDNGGKVATPAVLHENVQDSSVSVNVSVVIANNMLVM